MTVVEIVRQYRYYSCPSHKSTTPISHHRRSMESTTESPANKAPPEPRSLPFLTAFAGIVAFFAAWKAVQSPSETAHLVSTSGGVACTEVIVDGEVRTTAHEYLTDVAAVKGFHVLCIRKVQGGDPWTLNITAFKDGTAPSQSTHSSMDMHDVKTQLETLLEIQGPTNDLAVKYKQPYAFFSPKGQRLERLDDMVNNVVFLFEGGQFIWPGIRIGHKTVVEDVRDKGTVVMETLSMIPLIFSVEEFLQDDEIDLILDLSLDKLKPSSVALKDGHENRAATDWRTSTTYFLSSSAHPKLHEIDQRVADLTKVPIAHQEDLQVLRYEKTQKYDQHTDYFPAEQHRKSPHVLEMIDHGYKNRMITVFWYMSDVAKGGHTIFPRAGGAPQPSTFTDCSRGLKVPPKKRKVIVFYNLLPNGEGDEMSLHGGCPVEEGVKYSGNKWVWNKARVEAPQEDGDHGE
ncbi:hypothetical protein PsorP6_010622 [Peronosclerospora sorghi]|uniref:Uncharacterized protein n=1 Tax=Peronosclerospora sorghi TaxID=230839 RepID=A0ACC0VUI0_9STRA|nr:hypothetical protein PsorP6_010622 [Peronosclerospora sorghi]